MNQKLHSLKFISLFLALCLCLCLCACGESGYHRTDDLGKENLCLAFRYEDKLADTLNAALSQTLASGQGQKLSQTYFGEDRILMKGSSNALSGLPELAEERTLIMGVVVYGAPYAWYEGGELTGFAPDLARAMASQLGWGVTFQAVTPEDVCAQLGSGNIDCAVCLPSSLFNTEKYTVGDPILSTSYALATVGGSSSVKGGTVAVLEGDSLAEDLLASQGLIEKYGLSLTYYDSASDAVKAARSGDAQAVAMDQLLLKSAAN